MLLLVVVVGFERMLMRMQHVRAMTVLTYRAGGASDDGRSVMNVLQSDLVGLQREVGRHCTKKHAPTHYNTHRLLSDTRGLHHAPTSASCSTATTSTVRSISCGLRGPTAASVCVLLQYVVLQRTQEALAVSRMGENGPDLSEVVKACG